MIFNKNTTIEGKNVILVPYREEHVAKYHGWMKSEELQHLTASEPLTLEEEYAMQKSWLFDENKCTFIILDKLRYETTQNEIESMIGDTNLFFANSDDRLCAEAEIMIAEPWARGRKCGFEAMLMMFYYAITQLNVREFVVKISYDNDISINMFRKMGFTENGRVDIFREVTMNKVVDDLWLQYLKTFLTVFNIKQH